MYYGHKDHSEVCLPNSKLLSDLYGMRSSVFHENHSKKLNNSNKKVAEKSMTLIPQLTADFKCLTLNITF